LHQQQAKKTVKSVVLGASGAAPWGNSPLYSSQR